MLPCERQHGPGQVASHAGVSGKGQGMTVTILGLPVL